MVAVWRGPARLPFIPTVRSATPQWEWSLLALVRDLHMHTHTRAHTCTTDSFYTTHQSSYSGVCCCCYGTDPCVQREAATLDVWSLVLHSGKGYTHTVMCCACTYAVLYMYTHACTVHASVHTYICTYVHTYYMYMHIQTHMPLTCRALPPDNHYILYTVCTNTRQ